MAKRVISREPIQGMRDLNRAEIFTLDVLYQSDFKKVVCGKIPNNSRNCLKIRQLGGPPAPFPSDQLITVTCPLNNKRLNDAIGSDRFGKFVQARGIKYRSWLL